MDPKKYKENFKILNRFGTFVLFDPDRIQRAIHKAFQAQKEKSGDFQEEIKSISVEDLSSKTTEKVLTKLFDIISKDPKRCLDVEFIQDCVEQTLMENGFYAVAKSYILYRAQHEKRRNRIKEKYGTLPTRDTKSLCKIQVEKRDGRLEPVSFDKILERICIACEKAKVDIDPIKVAKSVVAGVRDGVKTTDLDNLTISISNGLSLKDLGYGLLAVTVAVSNLHKNTKETFNKGIFTQFAHAMNRCYYNVDPKGDPSPLIQRELYDYVLKHQADIQSAIDYERDYDLDLFGFKTLERSYLLRVATAKNPKERKIVERPQDMWMRVALSLHCLKPREWEQPLIKKLSLYETKDCKIDDKALKSRIKCKREAFVPDLDRALETYHHMSQGFFTHATPTLYNAGTSKPGLSSCFLVAIDDDSIEGIYKTLKDCALISKNAGGIGLHVHKIRANQSYIRGTGGDSNGLVPMLKVFNDTAMYVDQCFKGETIVHTSLGPQKIKDVRSGDYLLTATGNMRPVERVLKHQYDGEMLCISTKCALEDVFVTGEHQVLALQGQAKELNHDTIRNRLRHGYDKVEMVDAKDLCVDDFVCFPIPKGEDEKDMPDLDIPDLRFYGILVGSGWIKDEHNDSGLILAGKKSSTQKFVENYLKKNNIHARPTIFPESDAVRYQWSSKHANFKFRSEQMYDDQKEKIIWRPFFRLPTHKLLSILQGISESKGSISQTGTKDLECVLEMDSKNVVDGVRHMLMRCGIMTSGYKRDCREKVSYTLKIPHVSEISKIFPDAPKGKCNHYFVHDGVMYCRITDICKESYKGVVYDFEVADKHTYVTDMGAVHNGGGRRKGAFAIYLEPWHADIQSFLELKLPNGEEKRRARDLFYALWIPDYFMKCYYEDAEWYLMCPDECPGLSEVYGEDFEKLYKEYVAKGKYTLKIKARDLGLSIIKAQTETGVPYMLYKDSMNRKCNQSNLGTIQSSNLCCEICLYSDSQETAVCNLASIALSKFVVFHEDGTTSFDHKSLCRVTRMVTRNINQVIDRTLYPTPEAARSNYRHRPIAIGVQGLADVFMMMRMPFESLKASEINREIFETIYYGALLESHQLALEEGAYSSFKFGKGSPLSKGLFQFDLWKKDIILSGRWDWEKLRVMVKRDGVRNSLLVGPMPTASTSQILKNIACVEPPKSNFFLQKTSAGEFLVLNRHLYKDLKELGLWTPKIIEKILEDDGSVQNVPDIPKDIKMLYKTVWEIDQRVLIDQQAERGVFIDQSTSLNLYLEQVDPAVLIDLHFYGWMKGLKTGSYYIHSKPQTRSRRQKYPSVKSITPMLAVEGPVCTMEEGCVSCGS